MSAEENKTLFLRFFDDVWAGRDPDDENWPGDETWPGRPWMDEIRAAFSDLQATPDVVLAADDHVVIIFTVTAVHRKDYRGIPASGKPITFRGSTTALFENGKIVDEFAFATKMGAVMLEQTLDSSED